MLDGNALIYQLLTPFALTENVTLRPDMDVSRDDGLPLVTFTGRPGTSLANDGGGVAPMAWYWGLDFSVFTESHDEAKSLSGRLYDFVHGWNNVWGKTHIVRDLGHASTVTDRALFSKLMSTEVNGHNITQFVGAFDLQLHQA